MHFRRHGQHKQPYETTRNYYPQILLPSGYLAMHFSRHGQHKQPYETTRNYYPQILLPSGYLAMHFSRHGQPKQPFETTRNYYPQIPLSSGYLAMHFSRHGWRFGQTRCPHLQGTTVRTMVFTHQTTARHTSAVTPVTLTWLHMLRSRLWLVGQRKSCTIWQLYIQHCNRSNVLL